MPFTQREVDELYELTCRFHGLRPEFFGPAPRVGSKPPPSAEEVCDEIADTLRSNG